MRIRPFLLALSLAVIAACSGDDDDDDVQLRTFAFQGVDYSAHGGLIAGVRVLDGTNVVFCGTSGAIVSDFTITASSPILEVGRTYSVENFADLDVDNGVYEETNSDHNWAFTVGPVTTNVVLSFVHFSVPESAITWTPNTGCPGT